MRVLAILLALTGVAGAERTSRGPLRMRGPDQAVLGRDAVIALRMKPAAEGVRLVSTAGVLSAPVVRSGEHQVTLTLPTEKYPQLAVITAVAADGSIVDWLAIPLAGQARMRIDTEPRASAIVRVASVEFGPVQASSQGVAEVMIVVPPGATEATTIATSRSGGAREKTVTLDVRPFRRTFAVCSPQGDRVVVVAATATGEPSELAPLTVANLGDLAPPVEVAPGVYAARYAAPDRTTLVATITAGFAGEGLAAATCELRLPLEMPRAVRIATDRATFVAGTGPVTVRIALEYPGDRPPLAIDRLTFQPELGTATAPRRDEDGSWIAVWTLPDRIKGPSAARASARIAVPGGAVITGHLELARAPGAPVRIEATVPGPLRADGHEHGTIVVRMFDRFDNAVESPQLEISARGQLGSIVTSELETRAHYTAPLDRVAGDDTIEIRDPSSGLATLATIRLAPLPPRYQLGARLGLLANLGRIATPYAQLVASARLPMLREHLVAGIALGAYTTAVGAQAMNEAVTGRISVAPVQARLAYQVARSGFELWAGAGAGVAFSSARLDSPSAGMSSRRSATIALGGFVGLARRIGRGSLVVETGYVHARLEGQIAGRIGGWITTAGFGLDL